MQLDIVAHNVPVLRVNKGDPDMRLKPGVIVSLLFFASVLPGMLHARDSVSIREWEVPTSGSFPHDPAVGPDGALWYTGMTSDSLGRLDPVSLQFREYRLRTLGSGPHGLAADKNGNIWFTANYKGYIGRLDPGTGDVVEFPLPDPAAHDPHSLVFDAKGTLWFTVQTGGFVGSLDPATGLIRLKHPPTPHSLPYGITINSKGIPFFCEFGTNKLASISPDSMQITEYELPKGARPRRLAITGDNMVYYTDYQRGRLGRLDPKTKKIKEWASPSGADARPYGMATTSDGTVWYSESGVQPNTIVRFDPNTERFESWPIPSGGGVVRNMVATPGDDLYIACSGVNRIGIVKTGLSRGRKKE